MITLVFGAMFATAVYAWYGHHLRRLADARLAALIETTTVV